MKLWLAVPFLAIAQASCYDYEYYDPDTGASLGDACGHTGAGAQAGVTSSGQPLTTSTTTTVGLGAPAATSIPTTTFGAATSFGVAGAPAAFTSAPAATYSAPAISYTAPVSAYTAPVSAYTAPVSAYTAPVSAYTAPVSAYTTATPVATYSAVSAAPAVTYGRTVAAAPAAVHVATSAAAASSNGEFSIQRLKAIGDDNARLHRQNQRDSRQASSDLSRASLVNTLIAGSGKTTSWFPWYRLGQQQKTANAYKSEARIADRNAHIAYEQYQQNPTQLNALVSRYQDLNAQLHESAHHYNVINSGTFGQALSTGILGGLGGSALVSEVLTSRSENDDLQDIQRQMKRVARQITTVAKSQKSGSTTTAQAQVQAQAPQGSVQQRMMAMSVYGPNAGRG